MHYTKTMIRTTPGRNLLEITDEIQEIVAGFGLESGLCNIFIHHTSASLIICENADSSVLIDAENFMARLVRDGDPTFEHCYEGPDDMAAHIRCLLTSSSISIPVVDGRLALGTWQGIFLWEHRTSPHRRKLTISLVG